MSKFLLASTVVSSCLSPYFFQGPVLFSEDGKKVIANSFLRIEGFNTFTYLRIGLFLIRLNL